jgi:hypothetical protein
MPVSTLSTMPDGHAADEENQTAAPLVRKPDGHATGVEGQARKWK